MNRVLAPVGCGDLAILYISCMDYHDVVFRDELCGHAGTTLLHASKGAGKCGGGEGVRVFFASLAALLHSLLWTSCSPHTSGFLAT